MIDSPENSGANVQKTALFKNWSLYQSDVIGPQLPKNIKYTPPKPNEDLRNKIKPYENTLKDGEKIFMGICLSFLEGGTLEDDFGKDDWQRDKLLTSHTINIGGEETNLFELSKKISKLSGTAISRIIMAGSLTGEPDIIKKSLELKKTVGTIGKERGYFLVSDLTQFDSLALSVVEHYLSQQDLLQPEVKQ